MSHFRIVATFESSMILIVSVFYALLVIVSSLVHLVGPE